MTGILTGIGTSRTGVASAPGGVPLAFNAARGCPQQVTLDLAGHRYTLSLLASVADVAALRSVDITEVLFEGQHRALWRPDGVPIDAAARFGADPPHTLDGSLLAPTLVVREDGRLVGAQRVRVGAVLTFGRTSTSPLALDVVFVACDLTAGTLIHPGDTGGRLEAYAAARTAGADRLDTPPAREEGPYDQLP